MEKWIICLVAGLTFAAPIVADTTGFYVAGSYLNVNADFNEHSDYDDGYGFAVGYSPNTHLSAEVSYFDFGSIRLPIAADSGGTIDNKGISLQVLGKYPLGGFMIYGKVGNLWWDKEGTLNTISGPVKFSTDGSDLLLGIGCSYEITNPLSVKIEFIDSRTSGDDLKWGALGISYTF
jgi:hypothetical protein